MATKKATMDLEAGMCGAAATENEPATMLALPCGPAPSLSPSVINSIPAGLSDAEAASRLVLHGPNELPTEAPPTLLWTVLGALKGATF